MQKQLTTEKGTFLAVEVPSDASDFELSHFNYQKYDYTDDWTLIFKSNMDNVTYINGDRPHRHLPSGNWQILSTELNEQVAKTVVDSEEQRVHSFTERVYKSYDYKGTNANVFGWTKCALESLHSLLQANGIDHNKKIVLLKKI